MRVCVCVRVCVRYRAVTVNLLFLFFLLLFFPIPLLVFPTLSFFFPSFPFPLPFFLSFFLSSFLLFIYSFTSIRQTDASYSSLLNFSFSFFLSFFLFGYYEVMILYGFIHWPKITDFKWNDSIYFILILHFIYCFPFFWLSIPIDSMYCVKRYQFILLYFISSPFFS